MLEAARELDYVPAQMRRIQQHGEKYLVVAVVPENPAYFWSETVRGLRAAAEKHPALRFVTSLFSRLTAEADVLYCLDYAMELKPDLMIVTPPVSVSVQRKLSAIAGQIPVICLNETANFDFLFYVGADFYGDGMTLAREAGETLRTHPRILKIGSMDLPMVSRRDEGFRRELMNIVPEAKWIGSIDSSAFSQSVMPAQLAREIHEHFDGQFDSVYVSQGYLPQVLSALDKLKCPPDVAVFGYERIGRAEGAGRVVAVLEQDMFEQGAQCMEAAWRYLAEDALPEGRKMCVSSKIRRSGTEA